MLIFCLFYVYFSNERKRSNDAVLRRILNSIHLCICLFLSIYMFIRFANNFFLTSRLCVRPVYTGVYSSLQQLTAVYSKCKLFCILQFFAKFCAIFCNHFKRYTVRPILIQKTRCETQ